MNFKLRPSKQSNRQSLMMPLDGRLAARIKDMDWISHMNQFLTLVPFWSSSRVSFLLQPVLATDQLFRTATITSCISIVN